MFAMVVRFFVVQYCRWGHCYSFLNFLISISYSCGYRYLHPTQGTEYFDGKSHRYIDFPVTDVLQMMGRAGRPQFGSRGVACVLVHEPKKNFYRKFLYEPFPVESQLLQGVTADIAGEEEKIIDVGGRGGEGGREEKGVGEGGERSILFNHLNAEVASGAITSLRDCSECLTWTYFFRRALQNPSFYGLPDSTPHAVSLFLRNLSLKVLSTLTLSRCVVVRRRNCMTAPLLEGGGRGGGGRGGRGGITATVGLSRDLIDVDGGNGACGSYSTVSGRTTTQGEGKGAEGTASALRVMVSSTSLGRLASFFYIDFTTAHRVWCSFTSLPLTPSENSMLGRQKKGGRGRKEKVSRHEVREDGEGEDEERNERDGKYSVEAILRLLCAATEFSELPVRHNEEKVNAELEKSPLVRWTVRGDGRMSSEKDLSSSSGKAFLLLQAHCSRTTLGNLALPIPDYVTDTRTVLDQV